MGKSERCFAGADFHYSRMHISPSAQALVFQVLWTCLLPLPRLVNRPALPRSPDVERLVNTIEDRPSGANCSAITLQHFSTSSVQSSLRTNVGGGVGWRSLDPTVYLRCRDSTMHEAELSTGHDIFI